MSAMYYSGWKEIGSDAVSTVPEIYTLCGRVGKVVLGSVEEIEFESHRSNAGNDVNQILRIV